VETGILNGFKTRLQHLCSKKNSHYLDAIFPYDCSEAATAPIG